MRIYTNLGSQGYKYDYAIANVVVNHQKMLFGMGRGHTGRKSRPIACPPPLKIWSSGLDNFLWSPSRTFTHHYVFPMGIAVILAPVVPADLCF